jgi:hypothetical protein
MKKIFLTGVYRSGTTLLDKVLNTHPQVSILSQPFSPLYFSIKKLFLVKKGIGSPYPIGPDFMDDPGKEWSDFLSSHIVSSVELDVIFENIKNYKSEFSSGIGQLRTKVKEGTSIEIFEQLVNLSGENSIRKDLQYFGVKEILCEEFLPVFIKNNIKSMIIIRDPRDIICSLNFGKGKEYTGEIRPLLYSLRLWRKSVAYAINNKNASDFIFIKYEDLVLNILESLNKITSFLNISSYGREQRDQSLKDQNGNTWKGNSSFGIYDHINSGSIGKYKALLDEATIEYIENVCYPEMKYLGYSFEFDKHDINEIRNYKEPYTVSRNNFKSDYSSDKENISAEIKRIHSLKETQRISEEDQINLFLFQQVYKELKKTV